VLKSWSDDALQPHDRQRNGISNVKANGGFISTISSSRDETISASSAQEITFATLDSAQRAGNRIDAYDNVLS
jgi:hypothetical protein